VSIERQPRSSLALFAIFAAALVLFGAFVALGTWQIHRRSWKLELIARVNQRVHAPPVPAPPEPEWPGVIAANSEYRHVRASGTFLNDRETLVQATTELGAGYWVLTPLRVSDGSIVLVNRGFVRPERRDRTAHGAAEPTTPATVTGLLRMTEPGGGFLRHNDPAADRWYSRDIQAIAAARGLSRVAPYFIDAEAPAGHADASPSRPGTNAAIPPGAPTLPANSTPPGGPALPANATPPDGPARQANATPPDGPSRQANATPPGGPALPANATRPGAPALPANAALSEALSGRPNSAPDSAAPVPGLTVITFHNSHLVYVITWYTLALMVVVGVWIMVREERRLRRQAGAKGGLP
jgi:surfeit locus 1 family protein